MSVRDWLRGRGAASGRVGGEAGAPGEARGEAGGEADSPPAAADGPPGRRARRVTEIGWLIDGPTPAFLWEAPQPVARGRPQAEHPKAVNHCPAVLDGEARTWQVTAPLDLQLRIGRNDKGEATLVNAAGGQGTVAAGKLQQLVTLMPQSRWRDPKRPVLQVSAPYRFVCDEPCWLNQLPPYFHYRQPAWPGLLIGGRFPIHNWPRSLMWAFEWWDTARDLVIRRGEPWFYLRFETLDPARPLRLVEAEMTPELRAFCSGLDGVTNYTNQTFQLMATAASRRPPTLLTRRRHDRPRDPSPAAGAEEPHGG